MVNNIDIIINNHLPEWEQIIKEHNLDIEIRINNALEFNASAKYMKSEKKSIISINKGVFIKIYDFYHSVLTEKNPRFVQMAKYPVEYVEDCVYDENEAKTLADFYVYLSLKFVFLHELGHIMSGHSAYLQSVNSKHDEFSLNMNLNEGEIVNGITAQQYQMLEIDADSFAATNMLSALLNCYTMDKTYIDRFKSVIPTTHHLPLLSITSNIISMSLQGIGAKRQQKDLSKAKYIPMRMRLNEILRVYIKVYNTYYGQQITLEEILKLVKPFEILINQYLVETGYFDESILSEENNLGELSEEIHSHTKHLYNDIWPKLRSELIYFACIQLA
ncbi:hypothetical protein [Lysinibacillus parviboronicapiens]|uniref:hypothetical protein n=1 Tax=Lysinibacillus parviboronicapiens TaxID=436516 RepID=UPI0006D0BDC8|nr:hypothetical protein [Lysinibacillus parviboronicapiens]